MKQQIENLQVKIGKLMQDLLARHDFDTVSRLSPLLARTQEFERRNTELEQQVSEIENTLTAFNGKSGAKKVADLVPQLTTACQQEEEERRGRLHTLRIKVNWRANGRDRDAEEIYEHTAAASMASFVARLIQEFGDDAVQKLSRMRVNRGSLISRSPAKDFVNQAQGKLYGHKKLRGTEYYILTHSQTSQKVEDLNRVCRVLGLVDGSVEIDKIDRLQIYS